jgi:hypothetical protein
MPVLGSAALIPWSCPVNSPTGPRKDPDGAKTLVHVVDAAGNDFKVRYIPTFGGFHYQYSISFPNGTSREISTCIYDLGLNDAELVYTGPMSTSTGPTGTSMITVGTILIVEHSNIEGKGLPGVSVTPKPGGEDFHMVYDFRQKFRYRLNTVVGKGVTGTDYFESRALSPPHRILRADATRVDSVSDFQAALAGDTDFRRLDYSRRRPPRRHEVPGCGRRRVTDRLRSRRRGGTRWRRPAGLDPAWQFLRPSQVGRRRDSPSCRRQNKVNARPFEEPVQG